ncbi:A24 family peptidase [bacterium]|jgi:prepilin peptidase CpaA|nr:A24 family peptidase [bacterium]
MTWDLFVVLAIAGLMIVGAIIDGWMLKVPNRLTFFMILSGWLVWSTQGWNELGTSVLATFVAGALLLVPYAIGGMGAGDVKMYAGFGAWMVPIPWFGFQHLLWAFALSVLVGGLIALVMIWWQSSTKINLINVHAIVGDWMMAGSLAEIFARAKVRKPSLMLLPYGIPLTIGSLLYVAYLFPMAGVNS